MKEWHNLLFIYLCRQSQLLGELAVLEGSFTSIGYWYLGLSDLGREGRWVWSHAVAEVGEEDSWGAGRPSNKTANRWAVVMWVCC